MYYVYQHIPVQNQIKPPCIDQQKYMDTEAMGGGFWGPLKEFELAMINELSEL